MVRVKMAVDARQASAADGRDRGRRGKGAQDPSVYRPSAGGREPVKVPGDTGAARNIRKMRHVGEAEPRPLAR